MAGASSSHETSLSLLRRIADGDTAAYDEFFPLVYAELHRLAERLMDDERRRHTLQATALVHEAYLKMLGKGPNRLHDRTHFLRVASRAMRRVLVDSARKRRRAKRGGAHVHVELELEEWGTQTDEPNLLDLNDALDRLARQDPGLVQIVEMRFFGGLHHPEIADVLGMSLRQVERNWALARAWLNRELSPDAS